MNTLKELAIDACILFAAWFLVSAEEIATRAKGLSCGQVQTSSQAER